MHVRRQIDITRVCLDSRRGLTDTRARLFVSDPGTTRRHNRSVAIHGSRELPPRVELGSGGWLTPSFARITYGFNADC